MQLWKLAVLLAPLVAACSENAVVPTASPKSAVGMSAPVHEASRSISSGAQEPPPGVPPEYQSTTSITVQADVGFSGMTAWAQSVVNFGGNNGTADIELAVRNAAGSIVAANTGRAQASYIFPGNYGLTASTNAAVPAACGLSAQATAKGSVSNTFITSNQGSLTWGGKSESDTKTAVQPACPPPPPPVCKVGSVGMRPMLDCDAPAPAPTPAPAPGPAPGGPGSSPSTPDTPPPEPPTYYPPYYGPRPGRWVCIIRGGGTDWQYEDCTWYEDNDSRGNAADAPVAPFRAGSATASFDDRSKLPSVFVVVSDQLPVGAMAVVDRHRQGPHKNVLLVRSAIVRPADLVRAMRYLYDSRARDGETPAKDHSSVLRAAVADAGVTAAEQTYAAAFTALIANAKKADVAAYGTHQMLEIRMGDAKK